MIGKHLFDSIAWWFALNVAGAILVALLMSLAFVQLAGVWAQPPLESSGLVEQAAGIARTMDQVPAAERTALAARLELPSFKTRWYLRRDQVPIPASHDQDEHSSRWTRLTRMLDRPDAGVLSFDSDDADARAAGAPPKYAIAIELSDHSWVQFETSQRSWGISHTARVLLTALFVVLSSVFIASAASRRLARPVQHFADAAESFGSGSRAEPLKLVGPMEIREAASAFNAMQDRIQRLVDNRTEMLTAISHDLRAPLTRMRLRGEFIEDAEQQRRLFRDVDEMRAMVEASLAFFRLDGQEEEMTRFELGELINTVLDDFRDLGQPVESAGVQHLVYSESTPAELRRRFVAHQAHFQAVCLRQQASPVHDRSEGNLLAKQGQALERELQHALRHYASATLLAWSRLPGCVWTLESVLRDEHQPTGSQQVCHASLIAANLMQSGAPGVAACTPAFLSLAATARKLLHVHTGCGTSGCGAQRDQRSNNGLNYHPPGQTLTLEGATGVLSTLSEGVAVVGLMLEGAASKRSGPSSSGSSSSSSSGGVKSSAATPRRKAKMPNIPNRPKPAVVEEEEESSPAAGANSGSTASSKEEAGTGASAGAGFSPPSHQSLLHQLQTIQVASIAQLCHWQLGFEWAAEGGTSRRKAPDWLTELRDTLKMLVGKDLGELVDLLLSPALVVSLGNAQLGVNVALEKPDLFPPLYYRL
ncbi:MAG: hypothetical protein WDW38_004026 [Sanguina aurantia]